MGIISFNQFQELELKIGQITKELPLGSKIS